MPGKMKGEILRRNPKKEEIARRVRELFSGNCDLQLDQFKTEDVIRALGLAQNGSNRILVSKGISSMGIFGRMFIKGNVEDGGGYFFYRKPKGGDVCPTTT